MEAKRARGLCSYLQTTLHIPAPFCEALDDPEFTVELYKKLQPLYEKLCDALYSAYPTENSFDELLKRELGFGLNTIPKHDIISYIDVLMSTIEQAEAQGYLLELIAAAFKRNQQNPSLRVFVMRDLKRLIEGCISPSQELMPELSFPDSHSEVFLRTSQPALPLNPSISDGNDVNTQTYVGREEAIVQPDITFVKPGTELAHYQRCICRVEVPLLKAEGTGFLIGNGLVITNYHVMKAVFQGSIPWNQVGVRFDYIESQVGKGLQRGIEYALSGGEPIAKSPPEQLDYALLCLNPLPMSSSMIGQDDLEQRTWLTPDAHVFRNGEELEIIQHPSGAPLRTTTIPGKVGRIDNVRRRVYYTTSTLPGSSGAPCIVKSGVVAALHCTGSELENEGVPFTAILKDLRQQGVALSKYRS